MMRRLTEDELSREPPRPLAAYRATDDFAARAAALLRNLQRLLAQQLLLSDAQQRELQPLLEHAIVRGLRSES